MIDMYLSISVIGTRLKIRLEPVLVHQIHIDFLCLYQIYTANSKKVVLRKSKIQITKYKIQEKVCHITHMSGLFNFQFVIYNV